MENKKIIWEDLSVTVHIKSFRPENGCAEHHVIISYNNDTHSADIQFRNVNEAIVRLNNSELQKNTLVFKRYFLSDAANQKQYIKDKGKCAFSVIQQPPLDGTKAAVWLYYIEDAEIRSEGKETCIARRPSYSHIWHTDLHCPVNDEAAETGYILDRYKNSLSDYNCTIKDNCIRTWIFVQGVDVHYTGMVRSRKDFFEQEGLRHDTHYIASTGIEGKYTDPQALVIMDAYAVEGIKPGQINYLRALSHLSPTYKYGVTFERGTSIDYGDRRHIFISGTASIDKNGEIVHPGNIIRQTERTFENIQALLSEAEADMSHVVKMIVYLRDMADYKNISSYLKKHYSEIPYVIVWAPVCRPGWLVEVECIALKEVKNPHLPIF